MRVAPIVWVLACAASAAAGDVTGRVELVDKGGKQASDASDVVVWLEGGKAKAKPAKAAISMKGKTFLPHVVAVTPGSTIEFPNEDPIFHNVFSVSGENRFDLELYKRPKSGSVTLQHPGIVRVFCNIHPQMSAVVVVKDTPYLARAAADGSFSFPGLPAGTYTLGAWHERASEAQTQVTVPAEGQVAVQLKLDGSSFKRVQHKNKFGKNYPSGDRY